MRSVYIITASSLMVFLVCLLSLQAMALVPTLGKTSGPLGVPQYNPAYHLGGYQVSGVVVCPITGNILFIDRGWRIVRMDSRTGTILFSLYEVANSSVSASAICIDDQGTVFVADATNGGRILILSLGDNVSVISIPEGLAAAGIQYYNGTIYLTSSVPSGSIYLLNTDGQLISRWSVSSDPPMTSLVALAFNQAHTLLYATDAYFRNKANIHVWDVLTGSRVKVYSGSVSPIAISVDDKDNIYIVQNSVRNVLQLDSSGTPVKTFSANITDPRGIAINAQNQLVVADYSSGEIILLSLNDVLIDHFNNGEPPFSNLQNVAIQPNDQTIYVPYFQDGSYPVVHLQIDSLGKYTLLGKQTYTGVEQLSGFAVDGNDHLYLTDAFNDEVVVYRRDGSPYPLTDGLYRPSTVRVASSFQVYVYDTLNSRVVNFDASGKTIQIFPAARPDCAIALDSQNYLWITNGSDSIIQYSSNGTKLQLLLLEPALPAASKQLQFSSANTYVYLALESSIWRYKLSMGAALAQLDAIFTSPILSLSISTFAIDSSNRLFAADQRLMALIIWNQSTTYTFS